MKQKDKSNKKWVHPEQKDDEVCIGNSNNFSYESMGWINKRKGKVPFDLYNKKITGSDLFPVFVNKEEYDEYNSRNLK